MHFHKEHPVGARPGTLAIGDDAVPTRVRCVRYNADRLETRDAVSLEDIERQLEEPGVVWIDLQGLRDEPMLRGVADLLGLHPLLLEDLVNIPQRPKTESYDEHQLVITRMIRLSGHAFDSEQLGIVLGDGFVATFQPRYGDVLDPVRRRLRAGKGPIRTAGADYLAYVIVDTVVDAYYPVVEAIGDQLEALEDAVMRRASNKTLARLNKMKTMLARMRRALWPQRDSLNALVRGDAPMVRDATRLYLRDTHDHCVQLSEIVESYREMVTGLINLQLAVVSNRMNEVMKVLTIMASIFIPLTFMAGIYGMNFEHMPELHSTWGYPLLWAAMVVVAGGMLLFFRRRGWLGDRDDDAEPVAPSEPKASASTPDGVP
jgi:magnesium transporter